LKQKLNDFQYEMEKKVLKLVNTIIKVIRERLFDGKQESDNLSVKESVKKLS